MAISAYKDLIVFPNDNSGRVTIKEQVFTSSSTWTAPAGVNSAQVVLVGGGGGGGGGADNVAGGGGAGGAVIVKNIDVTPGTSYQVNIGVGGQGGLGALIASNDYTSTLPGTNGGTTTFGSTTVWNYLTNPDFDLNVLGWDPEVVYKVVTAATTSTYMTVYPNANGLVVGMTLVAGSYISTAYPGVSSSTSNIASNTYITNISGNTITLSAATSGAVNGVVRFDSANSVITQGQVMYHNYNLTGQDPFTGTNAFTNNSYHSPQPAGNYSNNLLQPLTSQLESLTLISSLAYLSQQGTAFSTFSIANVGSATKLPEMVGGVLTTTATGTSGNFFATLASTTGLIPNMFLIGTGFPTGTFITSISGTTVYLNQALNATIAAQSVTASYTGTVGLNSLSLSTGTSTTSGTPSWVIFSTQTATAVGSATQSQTGYAGVPFIPGQTYTLSAYVWTNTVINSGSTPFLFQLRSAGSTYGAAVNQNYLGGTPVTLSTSSIDAAGGTANGFFVRQATPTPISGYGASTATTITGSYGSGVNQFTVASATGLTTGMYITSAPTGLATTNYITAINGTTVTLSANSTQAITGPVSITFGTPSGQQVLTNRWVRVSATFTMPGLAAAQATGTYAYGTSPLFMYPTLIVQQPSISSLLVDNLQLELGSTPTTWQPPVYNFGTSLVLSSSTNSNGNLEVAHRPVRVTAGQTYSASMYAFGSGTANQYWPITGFIEWLDADYQPISRSVGPNMFLGFNGYSAVAAVMPATNYGARIGVNGAVAPLASTPVGTGAGAVATANAVYARVGFSVYRGAVGTGTQVQYNLIAPQLELASAATFPKKADNVTYFWSGQTGASQLISSWTVAAEGGGGGGTYNTNNLYWMFGIQGAHNGGHAAYNSTAGALAVAGGGAGSLTPGQNAQSYLQAVTSTTNPIPVAGWQTTAAFSQPAFPGRGNAGGYAIMNTSSNGRSAIPGIAGDGGQGTVVSGLNSGSSLGLALGAGGGGAGWVTWTSGGVGTSAAGYQFNPYMAPGRGTAGGGKGGGNVIVDLSQGTLQTAWGSSSGNYFARGIDAIPNTGSGGGGGSTNFGNNPDLPIMHFPANAAVAYEATSAEFYKWMPLYNATDIQASASAGIFGTNGLRVTAQDDGNVKIVTLSQTFQILPRTIITLPALAARLTSSPTSSISSPAFAGTTKRARPTIRWKDQNNVIIREDRPIYDIVFTALNTVNYLGSVNASNAIVYTQSGGWTTQPAPANAYLFDVTWEFDYLDSGDIVDVDISGLTYLGYNSNGGNGSDGVAIIRWFDKTTF
jgi:hypothetical protein